MSVAPRADDSGAACTPPGLEERGDRGGAAQAFRGRSAAATSLLPVARCTAGTVTPARAPPPPHLVHAFDPRHAVGHAAHVAAADKRGDRAAEARRGGDGVERWPAHHAVTVLDHDQAADLGGGAHVWMDGRALVVHARGRLAGFGRPIAVDGVRARRARPPRGRARRVSSGAPGTAAAGYMQLSQRCRCLVAHGPMLPRAWFHERAG